MKKRSALKEISAEKDAKRRKSHTEVAKDDIVMRSVHTFNSSDPVGDMLKYYQKHQVLHIRGCRAASIKGDQFGLSALQRLHAAAGDMVTETFTIETASKSDCGWSNYTSRDVLGSDIAPAGAWYTSFIAQGSSHINPDGRAGLSEFVCALPLKDLSSVLGNKISMINTEPIWVFVGRNCSQKAMLVGRPEHTDDVSHDGTWHYQAKGSKMWYLRPAESPEWGDHPIVVENVSHAFKKRLPHLDFSDKIERLGVLVCEGDVIIVNTRLWWHQTRIPCTTKRGLSISYARDFFCDELRIKDTNASNAIALAGVTYDNVDGLYASRRVTAGEIVLTESELPDCSLPRSDDPTCEIAWLEDGTGALIALKNLRAGDWLTVAPSDDESESEAEEDACCGDKDCIVVQSRGQNRFKHSYICMSVS